MSPDKPNNVDITSVPETHRSEKGKDLKTMIMEDFLNPYDRKSTSRVYKRGLELFLEWYGKDIEAALAERKDECARSTCLEANFPADFQHRIQKIQHSIHYRHARSQS
jgi:hypothetical protein